MTDTKEQVSDASSLSPELSYVTAAPSRSRRKVTVSAEEQAAIQQQYSELMAQNELLAKENRLFDSFLQRHQQNNPINSQGAEGERSPKVQQTDIHAYTETET